MVNISSFLNTSETKENKKCLLQASRFSRFVWPSFRYWKRKSWRVSWSRKTWGKHPKPYVKGGQKTQPPKRKNTIDRKQFYFLPPTEEVPFIFVKSQQLPKRVTKLRRPSKRSRAISWSWTWSTPRCGTPRRLRRLTEGERRWGKEVAPLMTETLFGYAFYNENQKLKRRVVWTIETVKPLNPSNPTNNWFKKTETSNNPRANHSRHQKPKKLHSKQSKPKPWSKPSKPVASTAGTTETASKHPRQIDHPTKTPHDTPYNPKNLQNIQTLRTSNPTPPFLFLNKKP